MLSKEFNISDKYVEHLLDLNSRYLIEKRTALEPLLDLLKYYDACGVMIGSDEKKEKGVESGTEIVFIQNENTNKKLYPQYLVDEFERATNKKYLDIFCVDKNLLPRVIKIGEDTLSFVDKNPKLIYPDRILNSTLVCGQEMVYNKSRQVVAEEMGLSLGLSEKIKEGIKDQIREYIKVCKNGVSRGAVCFDFENKCQYYDQQDKSVGRYGFKYGFIRLVQRKLDLKVQMMIKDHQIDIAEIDDLPTNTFEKICCLCPEKRPFVESYSWFLQNYHDIQKEYEKNKSLVERKYDEYSFDINKELILRCVEKLF